MDLTTLFCDVDDFVSYFKKESITKIEHTCKKYYRAPKLSESEIMTICILFHQSSYRNFKAFYLEYLIKQLSSFFPNLVSYNRFIELKSSSIVILAAYLTSKFDKATGISYIDSTPIQVCKPKRMARNKTFKHIGKKGKSTIGWFFGFKLHLMINERGGLLSVKVTTANTDDRTPVPNMIKNIFGKLFGDKGYISKKLSANLLDKGIYLITGIKNNMQNKLLLLKDKILLRKRSIIETVNDQLKNISQIEHSRHRSVHNFMVNLLCGLITYTLQPKKPSITGINDKLLVNI